jgi:energy-coupling factor transport system ATP-binding protein
MMLALDIEALNFKYKSWTEKRLENTFTNLNLKVGEKEKVLILASSDEGKTTLSRLIANLLTKFIPSECDGNIKLFGVDINQFEPYDLVEKVCYVSQNPMEMFITTTVENEIAFPFETMGVDREKIISIVDNTLKTWGLEKYRQVPPTELSGGERKRLLLAITFAIDAKIIILDEAFDDLDTEYRNLLSQKIRASDNTFIVFSARYLHQFENTFDCILVLNDGSIKSDNDFKKKYTHQNIDTYLHNSRLLESKDYRETNTQIKKHQLLIENLEIERVRESSKNIKFNLSCNNFSINTGEIVRLIGNNGSGKSTLSRVICGLDQPVKGNVLLNGQTIEKNILQTKVAYLFQNPDLQIFLPTVYGELAYGLENCGNLKNSEIKKKVQSCAKLFKLDLDETPSTMSFALRKYLQAAVYYLLDRHFIILDEIDGAMSYEAAYYIIDKLSENGAALIIITHDDDFAKSISDKTYRVKDGFVKEVL